MTIPDICTSLILVKSLVKWPSNAYRYTRSFRYHPKAFKNSIRSLITSQEGHHGFLVDNEVFENSGLSHLKPSEVTEVYYRDINAHIRTLFEDPDFASVLV